MKVAFFILTLFLTSVGTNASVLSEAEHKFDFGLRPRYTDITVADEDGRAASLLIRLSLSSTWTNEISTLIEYDNAETWFQDEHSDGVRFNGKPLVPDVPGDEINQALLQWQGRQLALTLGRQRIELANQRFVGSVAFWQNDQTYDALRAHYNFLTNSSAQYIYLSNVNRFWGDDAGYNLSESDSIYDSTDGQRPAAALGDHEQESHLLHFEFKEWDYSQVLLWYYSIENKTAERLSNDTFGAGYRFSYKAETLKYMLEADIAHQELTGFPSNSIPYYRFEAGLGIHSLQVNLSQESLGSDKGWGFATPLGSINDFQGWADVFFITPDEGVVDTRLQFDWRFNPFRLDARYHIFQSSEGNIDYGKEFDVDFIWKPSRKQKVVLRLSDFMSDYIEYDDIESLSLSWSYNL